MGKIEKYFFKIVIVVFSVIALLGVIFVGFMNSLYNKYLNENIYALTVGSLSSIESDYNNIYRSFTETAIQMASYPNLFAIDGNGPIEYSTRSRFIDSAVSTNEGIESVYLYLSDRNCIFNHRNMSYRNADEFFGEELAGIVRNSSTGIYNYYDEKSQMTRQIVIGQSDSGNDKVVMTLSGNKMAGVLFDYLNPKANTFVYYVDKSFVPLYKNFGEFPSADEVSDIFNKAEKGYNGTNFQKMTFRSKEYVVITKYSSTTNCVFLSYVPLDSFNSSQIQTQRYVYTYIILIFIAVLIGASLFMIRRYREPINDIKEHISELEKKDEQTKLRNYFDTILENQKESDEKYNDAYGAIENYFNSNELNLFVIKVNNAIRHRNTYGKMQHENIIGFIQAMLVGEQKILKKSIWNYIQGEYIVVLGEGILSENRYIDAMNKFGKAVYDKYAVRVTAYVSPKIAPADIPDEYEKAVKYLSYSFFRPSYVVEWDEPKFDVSTNEIKLIKEKIQRLCEILNNHGDEDMAREAIEEYFDILKNFSPDDVRIQINYLFMSVYQVMGKKYFEKDTDFNYILHRLNIEVFSVPTFEESYHLVENMIIGKLRDFDNPPSNKNDKLLTQIYDYINENFGDSNLCTNSIAEHFNYSNAYMMRVFKSETNQSLSNYILNLRLERSAQMLVETNMSIKNIFENCGFINSSYFSLLFKKKYGVTPSIYRNNAENV